MNKEKPKTRKIFIVLFFITLAGAGIYYYLTGRGYFIFGPETEKRLIESYRLYDEDEEKKEIILFYGEDDADGFALFKAEIFETDRLLNRVKQALLILTKRRPRGYIPLIPEGTMLREAYLDANNILYADFTEEITLNHKGGTTGEYLTVYSIVNTVFYNFPEIKGVKLLVDGKERETLTGHIYTGGIITADTDYSWVEP